MDDSNESAIPIENHPELDALLARLQENGEPCRVTRDGRTVALVVPVGERAATKDTPLDRADAVRRLAGSWANVDAEALKNHLRQARDAGLPEKRRHPAS